LCSDETKQKGRNRGGKREERGGPPLLFDYVGFGTFKEKKRPHPKSIPRTELGIEASERKT